MAKIQFTLEAWLKDKSQKVETGEGESVRILCTNAEGVLPIIGNVGEESENLRRWTEKGQYHVGLNTPDKDIFIVTPEEELTPFEKELATIIGFAIPQSITTFNEKTATFVKNWSERLLSLAREQFIKDGYVIEKKVFHDAVEEVEDNHKAKMSVEYSSHCKVENGVRHAVMNWDEFQKVAQKFIEIGKAEALKDLQEGFANNDIYRVPEWLREVLVMAKENGKKDVMKDLPRWRKIGRGNNYSSVTRFAINGRYLEINDTLNDVYEVSLSALEKLPRFKEDEQ